MKNSVIRKNKWLIAGLTTLSLFGFTNFYNSANVNASKVETKPATYYLTLENDHPKHGLYTTKDKAETVLLKAKEGQKVTVKTPNFKGYRNPIKKVTFILRHGKFIENILGYFGGQNPYMKDSIKNGASKVTTHLQSNIPNAKVKITNQRNIISKDYNNATLPDDYVSPSFGHFNTRTIKYYIQSKSKKDIKLWKSSINKMKKNGTLKFKETTKNDANLILKNSNIKYVYSYNTNLNKHHVITKGILTFNKNHPYIGDDNFMPMQGILATVGLKQNKYWDSMLYKERGNLKSNLSQGDKAGLAKAYKNVK